MLKAMLEDKKENGTYPEFSNMLASQQTYK